MKRFKDFKIQPILINAQPTHGNHSQKMVKPVIVTAQPVHGKHSSKLSESEDSPLPWELRHDNDHLGAHVKEVKNALLIPHEEWKKHPHVAAVKRYTEYSRDLNQALIAKAVKGYKPDGPKFKGHYPDFQMKHNDPRHNKWAVEVKQGANNRRMEKAADVQRLDRAIAHKPLDHDLHVYHGTSSWHPGEESAKHPDGLVRLPAFTSSSISKERALSFTGASSYGHGSHILHIHLKKGQSALPILEHSEHPREHEVLLPRDTILKIHPKPEKTSGGTHVWHATVHDK